MSKNEDIKKSNANALPILSVNGYMKKYAIDGIGKGADRAEIKEQLLDAFRKEIFDTAVMMVGPRIFNDDYEVTDKEREKLDNIVKNCNKKWKSLCREFAKYRETEKLINEDDLMKYMSDRDSALKANEEMYVNDEDIEEEPVTSEYIEVVEDDDASKENSEEEN